MVHGHARENLVGSVHQGLLQCVHSVVVLLLEQACMRARARATTHQLAYGRKQGARSCKQLPKTMLVTGPWRIPNLQTESSKNSNDSDACIPALLRPPHLEKQETTKTASARAPFFQYMDQLRDAILTRCGAAGGS